MCWIFPTISAIVTFLALKGIRYFRGGRRTLAAGMTTAYIFLLLAAWAVINGHLLVNFFLEIAALRIAWEFYKNAEDLAFGSFIKEIADDQIRFKIRNGKK